jgi:L-seryl-tRNA(Ser) seleniumtransferase
MIGVSVDELTRRAFGICDRTGGEVIESIASIGGGSLPGETMPSVALRFAGSHPDAIASALRTGRPRVFPIIRDDAVLIDLRAIMPEQDLPLSAAIEHALARSA